MFVGVHVAVEGEGWMVIAIDLFDLAYFKRKDCLQRNLYLDCVSL